MVLGGYRRFLVVLRGSRRFLVVLTGSHRFLVVLTGSLTVGCLLLLSQLLEQVVLIPVSIVLNKLYAMRDHCLESGQPIILFPLQLPRKEVRYVDIIELYIAYVKC